jgi:hypothetical protein
MTRILLAGSVVLLLTDYSWCQSNCEQIRQAVATYGYEAARQHALAHYGSEAVKEGDKCPGLEAPPKPREAAAKPHPKHKPPKKRK